MRTNLSKRFRTNHIWVGTALVAALAPQQPVVLNQDRYFRDWEELPEAEREAARTTNHPRAVRWPDLVDQVERLLARQVIEEPVARTASHRRGVELQRIDAADIVLIEGHLIFGHEPLRALMDLKIYLDVDTHERVLRRMLRDFVEQEVEPQALASDRDEAFNLPLFRKLGEMDLLGVTVPEEAGGAVLLLHDGHEPAKPLERGILP